MSLWSDGKIKHDEDEEVHFMITNWSILIIADYVESKQK